jgi:peptidoglycan/xylan/chitin deacetylase (PgdA/CDA1 family)
MRRAAIAGIVLATGVVAAFGAVMVTGVGPRDSAQPVTAIESATTAPTQSTAATSVPAAPAPKRLAQATPSGSAPATPAPPASPLGPVAVHPAPPTCNNPNALGISRVVEIDTTGGPGFGFQHFKEIDFLRDHEVVLTFDDGPWPVNTPAVLKALADQCTRAVFFPIGEHSMWHPEILREVAAAGHTIGSHTWSHPDLTKKSEQEAKDEIEKGLSAVHWALQGAPHAPFFRFPDLRHPPEMVTYLGTRNIAIFSTDIDSFDFKIRRPEEVVKSVMSKLQKNGKGIVLMHDFQRATSEALPTVLAKLKEGGYKIVFMVPKNDAITLPEYDAVIPKEAGLQTVSNRPASSVVHTIEGQ